MLIVFICSTRNHADGKRLQGTVMRNIVKSKLETTAQKILLSWLENQLETGLEITVTIKNGQEDGDNNSCIHVRDQDGGCSCG